MGAAPVPWDELLSLSDQPIPKFIRDMHRIKVKDFQYFGQADYDDTNDWTHTNTGTGSRAKSGVPSATLSQPCLQYTTATTNDGSVGIHNSKFIQMPSGTGLLFYLAWDFAIPTATNNQDLCFGIASGTGAQFFDAATRNVLTAGAGICIRRTASTNLWELFLKTAAGTRQTLASTTLSMTATVFYRAGFLVIDPTATPATVRVVPFLTALNTGGGTSQGDDLADLPATAFFAGLNGVNLTGSDPNHIDASATQCAIAQGAAGSGASSRTLNIRRTLFVQNFRR